MTGPFKIAAPPTGLDKFPKSSNNNIENIAVFAESQRVVVSAGKESAVRQRVAFYSRIARAPDDADVIERERQALAEWVATQPRDLLHTQTYLDWGQPTTAAGLRCAKPSLTPPPEAAT
jgi:hypothetical protein